MLKHYGAVGAGVGSDFSQKICPSWKPRAEKGHVFGMSSLPNHLLSPYPSCVWSKLFSCSETTKNWRKDDDFLTFGKKKIKNPKQAETSIFREKFIIIMFPLFASLCLILHPMKSCVEMISQNLQDQGYFLKEKVYFRNMDMCIFIFLVWKMLSQSHSLWGQLCYDGSSQRQGIEIKLLNWYFQFFISFT